MNRPKDPAFEIRDALDREVRRRLDPDTLCAALEEEARSAPVIHGGPLSRVPAAVQWVGIAAAVIAALTGLRSVYVDLTSTPEPAPQAVELAAVEPERPEAAEPTFVAPGEEVEPTLPEPAEAPEPSSATDTPPAAPAEELPPEPAEIVETPAEEPEPTAIAQTSPGFVATAPGRLQQASPPQRRTPPPRPTASQPVPDRTTQPAPIVTQSGTTVASVTGGVTYGQSSVRVTSFRYGGMNLEAKVSAVPNLGATLVTFGPPTGPADPAERPSGEPRELSSAPSTIPAASIDYHLRVLVGSTEDYLIEQRHAWLGAETDVVPLLGNLWFGSDRQKAILTELFDLRSIVATDNVRIPVEEGFADTNLVASAAGKRFELAVGVTPENNGSGRQLDLRIVYRPTGDLPRQRSRIEASLLVEEGEVVLIALPDRLLERRRVTDLSESEMLFVAISTGSEAIDETIRRFEDRIVEHPDNPPILIDGPQVDFLNKIAEMAFTDHGTLTLHAMVREDGTVDAIRLLGAPSFERADLLVEFAAAIVRSWRYLPAQDRGQPVATWVEVELEF